MKTLVILLLVGLVALGVKSDPRSNFDRYNTYDSRTSGRSSFSRNSGRGSSSRNSGRSNFGRQSDGFDNFFRTRGSRFNDFSHGHDDLYASGTSNYGGGSSNFGGSSSNFGFRDNNRVSNFRPQGRTRTWSNTRGNNYDMFGSPSSWRTSGTGRGTQNYGSMPAWMWMPYADISLEWFDDRRKRESVPAPGENTAAEVL